MMVAALGRRELGSEPGGWYVSSSTEKEARPKGLIHDVLAEGCSPGKPEKGVPVTGEVERVSLSSPCASDLRLRELEKSAVCVFGENGIAIYL